MMNDFNVTLPTIGELKDKVFVASDFAIANGVRFNTFQENGKMVNAAHVCSNTLRRKDGEYLLQTHVNLMEAQENPAGMNNSDYLSLSRAGITSLGFVPKFENPETIGMTLETKDGEDKGIIKIGDKMPTGPQSFAGVDLSAKLESLLAQNQLEETGSVTVDVRSKKNSYNYDRAGFDEKKPTRESIQEYKKYRFGDAEYVRVNYAQPKAGKYFIDETAHFSDGTEVQTSTPYWFKNEPYQAVRLQNGSIMCCSALLPGQFEAEFEFQDMVDEKIRNNPRLKARLDNGEDINKLNVNLRTEEFNAGKFLNKPFLRDMLQSVGLDLEQLHQQNSDHEM